MNCVLDIFYGFLIGVSAILPGFSGSVLAVMLNVYDKVINVLNSKNINFIKKIKKLLPLTIGVIIGVVICGKILFIFFKNYEITLKYIFIGFILGSVPILNSEIKKRKNSYINKKYFIIFLIISIIISILPILFNIKINNTTSTIKLFIAGFLYMCGKIVPGLSSSFFMIVLGLYDYVLLFFINPIEFILKNYIYLIPFFIGALTCFIFLIKLINYLLYKYFVKTYSAIIGFIISSILIIFPGFKLNTTYIISLILMIISFLFIIFINNVKNKS